MSPIANNDPSVFEVRNDIPVNEGEDPPTLLAEVGTWRTPRGNVSGIAVTTYGEVATLLSPNEARKFSKWLLKAAEELEGGNHKVRPGSKPSHYETDEDEA